MGARTCEGGVRPRGISTWGATKTRTGSVLDAPKISKMIDSEASVSDNYQRLVGATIDGVFNGQYDSSYVRDLRSTIIGQIREPMSRVFEELLLKGPGDPMRDGSFYFEKGASPNFHYKNLSGGEKAAFDLLLDSVVKITEYNDTIFCIDEPETHMNTRLQGRLLEEMFCLLPPGCQLWIATHSIGMMRKARDLQGKSQGSVLFIDFHDQDFDSQVELRPTNVNRRFWANILNVALDDLAELVAPSRVFLCEGRPDTGQRAGRAEFDAKCYRIIFEQEYPDTDFISVGNESDVRTDRLGVGNAIQALIRGTMLVRLVDRDDRSPQEICELQKEGVRVLSRRSLESYLLDGELLTSLCTHEQQKQKIQEALEAKSSAIQECVLQGKPKDDVKSAAGLIYDKLKRILQLRQAGNNVSAFLQHTMVPLMTPDTQVYLELRQDIFGE